jgi:ribosomal protein L33
MLRIRKNAYFCTSKLKSIHHGQEIKRRQNTGDPWVHRAQNQWGAGYFTLYQHQEQENTERLELKKYNSILKRKTVHREIK